MTRLLAYLGVVLLIDVLGPPAQPYMRRWMLRHRHWELRVHNVRRSDHARMLHDHPWDFISLILWGGYTEHTATGSRRFGPGSLLIRQAESLHRLELDRPAWTLVVTGPRRRTWGFRLPDGWVPHHAYRGEA